MASDLTNQLYQAPLAELQPAPPPPQPGNYIDSAALEEMTTSVSQMGIIQPEDGAMLIAAKCTELTYCTVYDVTLNFKYLSLIEFPCRFIDNRS